MGPLGSQTHAQAQKEGKNLSQNFSKKYVLDEPTQQTEPKLGEDRTSKKTSEAIQLQRGKGDIHKLVLTLGKQAFLFGKEVLRKSKAGEGKNTDRVRAARK